MGKQYKVNVFLTLVGSDAEASCEIMYDSDWFPLSIGMI